MNDYLRNICHGFVLCEKDGVKYFQIPSFVDAGFTKHCFTTRIGGVSEHEYATLNLSKTREKNRQNKKENYKRVCKILDVDYDTLTLVNYAHGDGVRIVSKSDIGNGITRDCGFEPCDALITAEKDVTILTLHADCVPIFFADPVKKTVAVCHAGWKGIYLDIALNVIEKLVKEFGSQPQDILIGIGPHIMSCDFEVQADVMLPFSHKFDTDVVREQNEQYYLDLQKALIKQLKSAGVLAYNITCADLCTYCNEGLFYSHRRDHGKTGAMGSFIAL
ncbi:MAG: peptidoglycan editing factor PgeF [Christensenellaceae bacterium]